MHVERLKAMYGIPLVTLVLALGGCDTGDGQRTVDELRGGSGARASGDGDSSGGRGRPDETGGGGRPGTPGGASCDAGSGQAICHRRVNTDGATCVVCTDASGAVTQDTCSPPPSDSGAICNRRVNTDGTSCVVCTDASGAVTQDTCSP